ncbi:TRAP transporter TatT component family protein [Thiogranum longum]|uniref:TRAP transporter TatT component family protein n=1 Tax=Thiogranum longum TaxID=1537524 RepID=A0A4V2PGW8_9GAMM|nr:TRAP transporter TatT component family protein [Thiogranum longum]TCK18466.1 TRAP transporter TatT component family protein [Thiogranum longum]
MDFTLRKYLLIFLLTPLLGACSMGQMVARTSVSIMDGAVEAMNRETDLVLAEAAIPANIKLIEGLIAEDPGNPVLLANAAQGLYGYAFGFTELQDRKRAEALYQRCTDYGFRALHSFGVEIDLHKASTDTIDKAVSRLGRNAVPALFWTASCWAKQIDLNRTEPARLAELGSTERLMQRVLELEPDYFAGSAYGYYGVYYGSRAPMLGGNFDLAEKNFSAARAVTQGKLLIFDVLQAEYLERQRLNQSRFHSLLEGVVNTPAGTYPDMALINQIARARARYLLGLEKEWF